MIQIWYKAKHTQGSCLEQVLEWCMACFNYCLCDLKLPALKFNFAVAFDKNHKSVVFILIFFKYQILLLIFNTVNAQMIRSDFLNNF